MLSSCGGGDTDDPEPNDACNYEGYSQSQGPVGLASQHPEADLVSDYFRTSSNGAYGELEIYLSNDPGNFNFVTEQMLLGTGTGRLSLNGTIHNVAVECVSSDTAQGGRLRYNITGPVTAEFCVNIDVKH